MPLKKENIFREKRIIKARKFVKAILKVYRKYGLSIGHEDSQGSFEINNNIKSNSKWLSSAAVYYDDGSMSDEIDFWLDKDESWIKEITREIDNAT